jgi:hypothetical protein
MGDKIRIVLTIAILILLPLAFIAFGIHGLITADLYHRRVHITGLPARLICGAAILGGLAIFRIYWFAFRGKGVIMDDGVLKTILVLAAIALGAGLIAGFFSVAF